MHATSKLFSVRGSGLDQRLEPHEQLGTAEGNRCHPAQGRHARTDGKTDKRFDDGTEALMEEDGNPA